MIIESVLGVVTGLVGNITTSFFNMRAQKEKNKHELAMVDAETKAMIAETNANIRVSEVELQQELEKADAEIYSESQKQGQKKAMESGLLEKLFESKWTLPVGVLLAFLLGIVDFLKHLMRPGLTGYLVFLTSWLTYEAAQIIQTKQELLTASMALDLFNNVVNIIIYLTVSVVTWWFGDRRVAKFLYRLNDGNYRGK
jgi:ABC-type multidrug transport system fused ATPase/permease subunit